MTGLLFAWLAEAGLISIRAVRQHEIPLPSEFLATFIVYGALAVVAEAPRAATPAAVVGWGIVIATFLNLVDPTDATGNPFHLQNPASPLGALTPDQQAASTHAAPSPWRPA